MNNKSNNKVSLPKFPSQKESLHSVMKKKVQEYFEQRGEEPHGNGKLYFKAGIFVVSFIGLYLFLLFANVHWSLLILAAALLGLVIAGIGFNIMHDGGHGSFSKSKFWNKMASYSGSIMGASQYFWNVKHNIVHHTYTNVDGIDDDIEVGAMLRLAPTQEYHRRHKYQHIYFAFLYMLMYVYWVFVSDYKKYFRKKIGPIPIKDMSTNMHIRFWSSKVTHLILFMVIPIIVVGFVPWLVGFLVASLVGGFTLSIVFQLAHTVETASFPMPLEDPYRMEHEFAEHQLATTSNFATRNPIVTWFLGGLNFQVEHHLFPKVSHVHYPAISKIIKQVCKERNVVYNEYYTLRSAVMGHVKFLYAMGKKPAMAM